MFPSQPVSLGSDESARFEPYRVGDERVLWTGRPSPSVVFHRSDWFMIPFSLMWGGFAIFWEWGASGGLDASKTSKGAGDLFMTLWGIPFILVGQYIIWGRFVYTALKKRRTFYALTTKRVLVLSEGATRHLLEGDFRNLSNISLTLTRGGMGSIDFGVQASQSWTRRRYGANGIDTQDLATLTFQDLPDAQEVHRNILAQRETIQRETVRRETDQRETAQPFARDV